MEPTLVTAAVLEKEGNILLAQRRENVHQGGKWEFPGGKVRPGKLLFYDLAPADIPIAELLAGSVGAV